GEKASKQTSFSVANIVVNGTVVGLTDKGFVPLTSTPPGADLNKLTGQPAEGTDTTIDSAGLAIGWAHDVPNVGLVRVRWILGRVRTQLESTEHERSQ